eukprot:3298620-Prymnesium_polylepis.1
MRPQASVKRQRASASRAHPRPESSGERCRAVSRAILPTTLSAGSEREPRPPPCPESSGERCRA